MGCGSSSAKGRENYSNLTGDPENTPLFSESEREELPLLNSYIIPHPQEDSPLQAYRGVVDSSFSPSHKDFFRESILDQEAFQDPAASASFQASPQVQLAFESQHQEQQQSHHYHHQQQQQQLQLPPPPLVESPREVASFEETPFAIQPHQPTSTTQDFITKEQEKSQPLSTDLDFSFQDLAIERKDVLSSSFEEPESLVPIEPPAEPLRDLTSTLKPPTPPPIQEDTEVRALVPVPSQQSISVQEPPPSPPPPSLAPSLALSGDKSLNPPSLFHPPVLEEEREEDRERNKSVHKEAKKAKKKKKRKHAKEPSKTMPKMDKPQPGSESGLRFDELYVLKGVLGTGAFSTVREGSHRSSPSVTFAVKCVNRRKLSDEDEAALLDEVSILQEMKHVHIIRLYDFFVESSTYYLVMERMSGGELFDRIVAKAYYNEKEARDVCKILLEAVGYCHENNVAHRDLKPENLLLLSEDDDSTVKIADFGFAKKVFTPKSLTTQCGTPGYVAPEILEGIPYDTRADMWSVGVILYILLGGYPPFIENNQRDLFRKIRRGEYEFHEEYWGTVSTEAKDLISSLLTVDPVSRLDAGQALDNPWIRKDDAALAKRDLGANLKELTKYNAKRKFKAAVSTVMAVNKLQSLGKDFLNNLS